MTKALRETITRITTRLGCRVGYIHHNGAHYRVKFTRGDKAALITMACTASDRRATDNQLADVRRKLR